MAHDNKLLGHFRLDGIKPARRGQPRIEVTFNIDVNGIVKVSAKDLDTQKAQEITITGTSGLSKDEIDRMVKEAEAHKEADEKRREQVELKNKAEQYISSIEEGLKEKGNSIDPKQKEETEKLLKELKEAVEKNDYDKLKNKISELEKAAEILAQAQANQGGTTEAKADDKGTNGDDVVDADFSETDKKD